MTGSIGWPSPGPRLHADDCFEIHNLHTENFVICCYQITNIFCTMYDSANASSARRPCDFGPLADLANFGLSGSEF